MRNKATMLPVLVATSASLSGCAAVKGIFEAGMWTGIVGIVILVGLIAGALSMFRNGAG